METSAEQKHKDSPYIGKKWAKILWTDNLKAELFWKVYISFQFEKKIQHTISEKKTTTLTNSQ